MTDFDALAQRALKQKLIQIKFPQFPDLYTVKGWGDEPMTAEEVCKDGRTVLAAASKVKDWRRLASRLFPTWQYIDRELQLLKLLSDDPAGFLDACLTALEEGDE